MKELILIEYFTALQNLDLFEKKTIFSEAIKLTDEISLNFIENDSLKKIYVIRNQKLKRLKKSKISYLLTSKKVSLEKVLNTLSRNVKIILIAPESKGIFINLYQNLTKKGFTLLNSGILDIKKFSSKKKTFLQLKKFNIPSIEIRKDKIFQNNTKFISKPEYGAGSENINFLKDKKNFQLEKSTVIQKFFHGKKGSFSMVSSNGKTSVIACNKQIVSVKDGKVKQVGIIIGGYENFRETFEDLAKKISKNFTGLQGFIGVDVIESKKKWKILEINSRFTSSYIGIKSSYGMDAINFITNFYVNEIFLKNFKSNLLKKTKFYFNE